jgi:hypothetical protein
MKPLSREERLQVLEFVTEIAGEAAKNTSVIWMIEFQEELVERLYRRMVALLEEPRGTPSADGPADGGTVVPETDGAGVATAQVERKVAKKGR